jgi:hypothetical protein
LGREAASGGRLRLAVGLANDFGAVLIGRAAGQVRPLPGDPVGYADADYLEYGYSRLREWLFGGVTQALLSRCPRLSH